MVAASTEPPPAGPWIVWPVVKLSQATALAVQGASSLAVVSALQEPPLSPSSNGPRRGVLNGALAGPLTGLLTWPLALWLVAIVGLGLWSRADLERRRDGRCSLDGLDLTATARVDLVAGEEEIARFCCTTCAAAWPDVPAGAWWRVLDEATGATLPASEALFVWSRVETVRARRDHLHAFARLGDALAHADAFGGRLVPCPLPAPHVLEAPTRSDPR